MKLTQRAWYPTGELNWSLIKVIAKVECSCEQTRNGWMPRMYSSFHGLSLIGLCSEWKYRWIASWIHSTSQKPFTRMTVRTSSVDASPCCAADSKMLLTCSSGMLVSGRRRIPRSISKPMYATRPCSSLCRWNIASLFAAWLGSLLPLAVTRSTIVTPSRV